MYATLDTTERTFTINLSFISVSKDRRGKVMEHPQSNVFYMFDLLDNGKLKFKQIRLAG
jgi:hypothetical protein